MNRYHRLLVLSSIIISHVSLQGYDDAHFYRATNFFMEPRIDRNYLTSLDFFFGVGSTSKGLNRNHEKVPLFDIYGPSSMHELGIGVPGKDLTNPYDLILEQLSLVPSRCATSSDASKFQSIFATYSIGGEFSIFETIFSYAQNIKQGFFFHIYFPIRRFKVNNTSFCDISPTTPTCPNNKTPIWQIFQENFDAILCRYDLSRKCYQETNIGDMSVLLGWTHSFNQVEVLDFVDTTFKIGVLIPSGEKQNIDNIFSIPFGYNKHTGAIFVADFAFGAFDWLTLGAHIDTIVFGNKTMCVRFKTGQFQSGIIKLAKGEANVSAGTVWEIGSYLKFDHFIGGFSLMVAYSFANQNRSEVTPCNTEKFNTAIANSDATLNGFTMHTINLMAEFDFATEHSIFGPRIAFYYDMPVAGKYIFNTDMFVGNIGIDIAWDL